MTAFLPQVICLLFRLNHSSWLDSKYASVGECQTAINRYFGDRNTYFRENPQKQATRYGVKRWPYLSFMKRAFSKIPVGDSSGYLENKLGYISSGLAGELATNARPAGRGILSGPPCVIFRPKCFTFRGDPREAGVPGLIFVLA
jgi:hypothetical protein